MEGKISSWRPSTVQLLLILAFLQIVFSGCHEVHAVELVLPPEEVEALKQIDAKLKIGWDFSVNPCSGANGWLDNTTFPSDRNVTCGDCNSITNVCHVVNVLLKSQNLSGVLPDEFANLTSLVQIDLTRNYINGTFPAAWGSLPLLQNISLLGNRIYGRLPKEIGSISNMRSLVLEQNLFEGPLPAELGNLKFLSRLIISSNFFAGALPSTFSGLQSLIDMIDGNNISGTIPDFIGSWTKLVRLDIQGTPMGGPFPMAISKLTNLSTLRISDYQSDGLFPPLRGLPLQYLVLRNCSIYGKIPDYIGGMPLISLDLSFNNFAGEIPGSFGTLGTSRAILNMYFTNNSITGVIPKWAWNFQNYLDLSYNSFSDPSPPSTCQHGNVNLRASFTSSDSNLIPCQKRSFPCLGKAKNYDLFINCGGRRMTIGQHEYEEDIDQLGASRFFSSPSGKWAFSSTGDFVDTRIMANYIVENTSVLNMTSPELSMTARRSPLSLKYYGLCLQKGNYTVRLHFAEIIFTDDRTFASVGIRLFDVSIQGQKVLRDFDIAKEAKGVGREVIKSFFATVEDSTLEIHFQWAGRGTNSIPQKGVYGPLISAITVTPNFKPVIERKKIPTIIIIIIVCGALLVVALVGIFYLFFLNRRRSRCLPEHLVLSLQEIELATENFSRPNLIGVGGFARVYKGKLPDGFTFAVKRFLDISSLGMNQFIVEIGTIMALRHPNLVKLYGSCSEGNQLLLLLEYMENKDVAHHLFGSSQMQLELDWQTRRRICLQVARGLAYLHEGGALKIIHRDIKLNNILLDKDLNAKISDFGLAESEGRSTIVAGTPGYMAPEYKLRRELTDVTSQYEFNGELTAKVDVYSFGVVMLEMVSGQSNRPVRGITSLLELAYTRQRQGRLVDLVDKRLSNYVWEEAKHMLNLALACTHNCPDVRPKMSAVVCSLENWRPLEVEECNSGHEQCGHFPNVPRDANSSQASSPMPSTSDIFNDFPTGR